MWFLAVILEVQETCGDAVSFFERKHGRRAGLESDLYIYLYINYSCGHDNTL